MASTNYNEEVTVISDFSVLRTIPRMKRLKCQRGYLLGEEREVKFSEKLIGLFYK